MSSRSLKVGQKESTCCVLWSINIVIIIGYSNKESKNSLGQISIILGIVLFGM